MMLILVSAVGFGCGLNYREVGPFWLPLTVWMGYRFTGGGVLPFVRRLPAILVTVLTGGRLAVSSYSSSGGDVFFSESVRRLRPVTIFREFIGGTNTHLNRDL